MLATAVVALSGMPVETIGSRFGGIPAGLPAFTLPDFSWESARHLLMPTITLALLEIERENNRLGVTRTWLLVLAGWPVVWLALALAELMRWRAER